MLQARVFNIQRYSIHDGPGIRTTVFFKGCNLRCLWCHNPESYSGRSELEFNRELCISCGRCFELCAEGAHVMTDSVHTIDRTKCKGCGTCAADCFAGALTVAGTVMTADEIMDEILTDAPYYEQSGGGVTFSGGECMLQIDMVEELCRRCAEAGIETAVDTAGNVPWAYFERVLPYKPLFLYDIKAVDPALHKTLTSVDNALILENLSRLIESGARIWIRMPVVPGANDGEAEKIAAHLAGKSVERVELLTYHKLGLGKAELLGAGKAKAFDVPDKARMEELRQIFVRHGVDAKVV